MKNKVGSSYQDGECEDVIRERLSIQRDKKKLIIKNPKKQGYLNNLFSNHQKTLEMMIKLSILMSKWWNKHVTIKMISSKLLT